MTEDPTKSAESLPVVGWVNCDDLDRMLDPSDYAVIVTHQSGWSRVALTPHAPAQAQIDALRIENERLRREVGELRDALTPFAMAPVTDDGAIIGLIRENFDDARAALKAGKETT